MKKYKAILPIALILCVGSAAFFLQGLVRELHDYNLAKQVYELPLSQVGDTSLNGSPPSCQDKLTAGKAQFSQQIAWLQNPGTTIDYPVVQGSDNSFYLTHLANGKKNPLGAIFLDATNQSDFSAPVSTIYGHRVASGQMFDSLTKYRDQAYYDLHPTMWLCTEQAHYSIELLSAYLISGSETYPQAFPDEAAFFAYIQQAKNNSLFKSTVIPQFGDRLIILSTCDYTFQNARLTVLGRLLPAEHSHETRKDRN